jgi:hypothetical protein
MISSIVPGEMQQLNWNKLVVVNVPTPKMKKTKAVSPCELVVVQEEVVG